MRKFIKIRELLIICVIAVFAAVLAVLLKSHEKSGRAALIYYDGNPVETVLLDSVQNGFINIDAQENVHFEVKDGKIAFVNVNCPDKICEKYGFIGAADDIAVCMPNRVYIKIISDYGNFEIDAKTR